MSATYNIGDLLKASAVPNVHEVRDLQQIGAFAAGLYKRLLAGPSYVQSLPGSFSEHLSGRFANASADRWSHTSALIDLLTEHWASAGAFNVASGYHNLDADRSLVALYEEEDEKAPVQSLDETPIKRARGLFGAKTSPKHVKGNVRQLSKLLKTSKQQPLAFKDGATISPLTIAAFESAGLPLLDQVSDFSPHSKQNKGENKAIELDSLLVDGRTPALNAALTRVTAVSKGKFERFAAQPEGKFGLSTHALATSKPFAQSRAYGLFDAADTRYLSLENDTKEKGTSQSQLEGPTVNRVSSLFTQSDVLASAIMRAKDKSSFEVANRENDVRVQLSNLVPSSRLVPLTHENHVMGAQTLLASQVVSNPSGQAVMREQRGAMWAPRTGIQISEALAKLSRVPRQKATQDISVQNPDLASSYEVAPFLMASSQAKSSVYDGRLDDVRKLKDGTSRPVDNFLTSVRNSNTLKSTFRSKADLAADLPLGATLTAYEAFAGYKLSRIASESDKSESFSTIGAQASARNLRIADVGDGMVWVAGKVDAGYHEEPSLSPLSLIPMGRSAVQVPATLAYAATSASVPKVNPRFTSGQGTTLSGDLTSHGASNATKRASGLASSEVMSRLGEQTALLTSLYVTGTESEVPRMLGATEPLSSGAEREFSLNSSSAAMSQLASRSGLLNLNLATNPSVISPKSFDLVSSKDSTRIHGTSGFSIQNGVEADFSGTGVRPTLRSFGEGLLTRAVTDAIRSAGYARLDSDKVFIRALNEASDGVVEHASQNRTLDAVHTPLQRSSLFETASSEKGLHSTSDKMAVIAGLKPSAPAFYKSLRLASKTTSARELAESLTSVGLTRKQVSALSGQIRAGDTLGLVEPTRSGVSDVAVSTNSQALTAGLSGLRSALQRTTMTAREINELNVVFASLKQAGHLSAEAAIEIEPSLTKLTRKYLSAPTANASNYEVQLGRGSDLAKLNALLVPTLESTRDATEKSFASNAGYETGPWRRSPDMVKALLGASADQQVASHSGVDLTQRPYLARATQSETNEIKRTDGISATRSKTESVMPLSVSAPQAMAQQIERNLARTWMGAVAVGGNVASGQALQALASAYSSLPTASPILRALAAQQQRNESTSATEQFGGSVPTLGSRRGFANLGTEMSLLSQASVASESVATQIALQELQASLANKAQASESTTRNGRTNASPRAQIQEKAPLGNVLQSSSLTQAHVTAVAHELAGTTNSARVQKMVQRLNALVERTGASKDTERLHAKLNALMELGDSEVTTDSSPRAVTHALAFRDAERLMISLERQAAPSLEDRVAQSLAQASFGPAGVRRLLTPKANVSETKAQTSVPRHSQTASLLGKSPALSGMLNAEFVTGDGIGETRPFGRELGSQTSQSTWAFDEVSTATKIQLAALNEERVASNVNLNQAIVPEVMMTGARSHLVKEIKSLVGAAQANQITGLNLIEIAKAHGLDFSSAREAYVRLDNGSRQVLNLASDANLAMGANEAGDDLTLAPQVMRSKGYKQTVEMSDTQSQRLSPQARRGMLSSLLKQAERAELISLIEQSGAREFAEQWGARVDGSKTGLELGYAVTKEELDKTFGKRRMSSLVERSELSQGQAQLLAPAANANIAGPVAEGGQLSQGRADRSGLRRVASELVTSKAGASRPQHQAERAIRRTDWRFVETGSRAATPHADLGKLAAAVVSNSETSKRAPMPLVAPAVKAIAQTALRKSTTETESKPQTSSTSSTNNSAASGAQNQGQPKLTEQAIELLAVEMANRVARLMGLMKERIGVWA